MTEHDIRMELRQVRYYHLHKKHLDISLKNGIPNRLTQITKKYNRLIKDAPILLYHIYVNYTNYWLFLYHKQSLYICYFYLTNIEVSN